MTIFNERNVYKNGKVTVQQKNRTANLLADNLRYFFHILSNRKFEKMDLLYDDLRKNLLSSSPVFCNIILSDSAETINFRWLIQQVAEGLIKIVGVGNREGCSLFNQIFSFAEFSVIGAEKYWHPIGSCFKNIVDARPKASTDVCNPTIAV